MGTEVKLIAGAAILIVLIALGFWSYRVVHDDGKAEGLAEKQVEFDQYKIAVQKAADAQIAQATAERDAAIQSNEVITRDLQAQLSATQSNADSLLKRVRDYEASLAAYRSTVPKAAGQPGTAAPGGESEGAASLDRRIAAYDAACQRDAIRLDKLIAEISPQL